VVVEPDKEEMQVIRRAINM